MALLVALTVMLTPLPAQAHYSSYCGHGTDYNFWHTKRVKFVRSYASGWPGHWRHIHVYKHQYRGDRWRTEHKWLKQCSGGVQLRPQQEGEGNGHL